MRIELPREVERFGPIMFYDTQKVYELDSGLKNTKDETLDSTMMRISYESFQEIQKQMVIVVPVKEERIKLIEGVLYGIPHNCLIIVVSNSPRGPVDRFSIEKNALERLATFMNKRLLVLHQKDPIFAEACKAAGYNKILDKKGVIKSGKAEGMILATFLGVLSGKKYIGFIDSDNYFPGSVHEYVQEYSAGFHLSKSKYSMVRISWHSKPKIMENSLFFAKRGRASEHTNKFLNSLLSHYIGFGTEIIKTGNAGEHAISMDLAAQLDFSSGYSIEPYHFISMLERFGGIMKSIEPQVMKESIELFQIESRNPHLHEVKGDEHVKDMSIAALEVLYRSPVVPDSLKKEILKDLFDRGMISDKKSPMQEKVVYYPAVVFSDLKKFQETLANETYADLMNGDIAKYVQYKESADGFSTKKGSVKKSESGRLEIK
jgi:mannosyl-3-phosphoglycerate synthase